MRVPITKDDHVAEIITGLRRTWFIGGVIPLLVAAVIALLVGMMVQLNTTIDPHNLERGFLAVLAVSAALFLTGFWLDGYWTHSERLARRIHTAVGAEGFSPSRSQLAAKADIAISTVTSSHNALVFIGGAIGIAAIISAAAGLGIAGSIQILLIGFAYQLFILSRQTYYHELLTAALRGELVIPEPPKKPEPNHRRK